MMNVEITFLYEILKIQEFYLSSSSQVFRKKEKETNISDGTIILSCCTYTLVLF